MAENPDLTWEELNRLYQRQQEGIDQRRAAQSGPVTSQLMTDTTETLHHQRDLLAEALGKLLVHYGVVRYDAQLTGPELLLAAETALLPPTDIVTKLRDHLFLNWAEAQHAAADEIERLRSDVIAFCAPYAAIYARDCGFPPGHLHPTHYDILKRCGARMDDFTRAEIGDRPDAE